MNLLINKENGMKSVRLEISVLKNMVHESHEVNKAEEYGMKLTFFLIWFICE